MSLVTEDFIVNPLKNGVIVLQGEVHRENVLDMVEQLIEDPIPFYCEVVVDIADLEIESGLTLLTLVNTFKAISRRVSSLTIAGAPKPLYNSMYSTGLLSGPNPIRIIQVNEESALPA